MTYIRTFLVKYISNDITIEQFRDSMEYLGSICRIDKTPFISEDHNTSIPAWNAYIYYESWKSTQANKKIDKYLSNRKTYKTLCFIDQSGEHPSGHIDAELNTPTISVYPLRNAQDYKLWFLCRNNSMRQFDFDITTTDKFTAKRLIRFIPETYHVLIHIPQKHDKTGQPWDDSYIEKKLQLLKIGDIARIEKYKVLYDDENLNKEHDTIIKMYLHNWYVSEWTMLIQDSIAAYKERNIMVEMGEPMWKITKLENFIQEPGYETWVRPNQHLYFDE